MTDRTPIYLMSIVGLVALVAVVYMLTGQSTAPAGTNLGSSITGNVVASDDVAPADLRGVGRFIFGIALLGSCVYMYKKWE